MEGSPDDGNGDRGERDVPSTAQRIAANDQVGREWISELPDGKAPFPDDPLFDTERDQLENRLRDDPDADPDR